MKILLFLAALSFFGATGATPTDRPISLPLEDIPAGAAIYSLDGNSGKSTKRDHHDPFSEIAKRATTDCATGSAACGTFGHPDQEDCYAASRYFDDNAWYCGYTTRYSGFCIAKFECDNFNNDLILCKKM